MRRQEFRRTTKGRSALGIVGYLLFCALLLAGGTLFGWLQQSPLATQMLRDTVLRREPKEAWGGKPSVTLLLLGCDEDRYYGGKQIIHEQARSDLMLVAKLDFANNRISGISIPRDTLASPKGYRNHKINAYHLIGGPELSERAVESILPLEIDRVIVLNYQAFEDMVDLVGGVEVDVPKKMDYDDDRGGLHIHLKKGVQRLGGKEAVGFVRFRHTDDDFRRQARQKAFLMAFKDAALARPAVLPQVAEKAKDVMGGALNDEEISSLALFARGVGNQNIKLGMLPTVPTRRFNLRVDQARLKGVLKEHDLVPRDSRVASGSR